MSTRRKRAVPQGVSTGPVGRALAHQQWSALGVDAQIHAMIGGDPAQLCNLAGRMFFVILGAAIAEAVDPDDTDLRIVRGAVNAVYEQVDRPVVDEHSRAGISAGLRAVQRLAGRMRVRSMADAYFDLLGRLRAGDVAMDDFLERINRIKAAAQDNPAGAARITTEGAA